MNSEEIRFADMRALRCTAGALSVVVALDAGPRVLALEPDGGPNLFVSLPGVTLGAFRFLGGHRLWSAPEVPERTYRPDGDPVELSVDGESVGLVGPVDPDGIRKVVRLTLLPDRSEIVVLHELRNEGEGTHEIAPWAITQAPLGGVATLPMEPYSDDPDRLLPNRSLVLWPYTRVGHPALHVTDDAVRIDTAHVPGTRLKVGVPNRVGRISYEREGWLFTKSVTPDEAPSRIDLGATIQAYADERFIELETIGRLALLGPGDSVEHRELWEVARA